jgi:hypothetical protein
MAPALATRVLKPATGIRSPEAGSFLAQLDDLSARMFADLRGFSAADLAWQARPGTNTAGMLLIHMAGGEVHWLLTATTGTGEEPIRKALGIGVDDDGIPLPPNGRPPANLRGWTLADYKRLHDRARRFTRRTLANLPAADMSRGKVRVRWSGEKQVINTRWILYNVLTHQAAHYGQILLLRHMMRAAKGGSR